MLDTCYYPTGSFIWCTVDLLAEVSRAFVDITGYNMLILIILHYIILHITVSVRVSQKKENRNFEQKWIEFVFVLFQRKLYLYEIFS